MSIIHNWSGPRSLSTCFMYSFSQRSDCQVLDEPLYAHHLTLNPMLFRPYRDELLRVQSSDDEVVLNRMVDMSKSIEKPFVFAKHMGKHYSSLNKRILFSSNSYHIILIRDPIDMLLSWSNKVNVHQEPPNLEATSLPQLVQIFSDARAATGVMPIVIDASILKRYPEIVMKEVCYRLGISYTPEQLSWPVGPKSVDGLWAPYWYDEVHKSSGFSSGEKKSDNEGEIQIYPTLTAEQLEVYREALPFYLMLRRHAIGVDPLNPGSSRDSSLINSSCSIANFKMPVSVIDSEDQSGNIIVDHGLTLPTDKLSDPRNADLLIWVGDRLYPRELAKVSVFDSAVQGGDAVWEVSTSAVLTQY